jgi:hypothetical protein
MVGDTKVVDQVQAGKIILAPSKLDLDLTRWNVPTRSVVTSTSDCKGGTSKVKVHCVALLTLPAALIAWCMIVISHPNHRLEYASELKWSGSFYDFQVGKRFL